MGFQVVNNAICRCSCGTAPAPLGVLPVHQTFGCKQPAANIMDHNPFVNIRPFGLCVSGANPVVAAALMVPQPCTPNTPAPWVPGAPTVLLNKMPTLNNSSQLFCNYAGVITINYAGQPTVFTP